MSDDGPPLDSTRHWVSIEDDEDDRTWMFDATFLTSRWTCIYGRGCLGIEGDALPEHELGCCSHGAWLSDEADLERVVLAAAQLGDRHWQFREIARRRGGAVYRDRSGDWRTRRVQGACIFLNRPDFGTGAGCALHSLALDTGREPLETKPEVCWQIPLRREDHRTDAGHLFSMIREWNVRDWGGDPADVAWWCSNDRAAHSGGTPVYESMRAELVEMVGRDIYDRLEQILSASGGVPVGAPVRRRA